VNAATADNSQMARGRHDAALKSAIQTDSGRLYGIAFSVLRDQQEAEDAVQETWIRVWRNWNWAHDAAPPAAWVTRVCVNVCLNRRRGLLVRLQSLRRVGELQTTAMVTAPSAAYVDLIRAYETLSAKQRAAIALSAAIAVTVGVDRGIPPTPGASDTDTSR
jgi:DNA-directed RNA polymerase specialized sigma24 family protein